MSALYHLEVLEARGPVIAGAMVEDMIMSALALAAAMTALLTMTTTTRTVKAAKASTMQPMAALRMLPLVKMLLLRA